MAYPSKGGGGADEARGEEMRRQSRVRQGTKDINQVFGQFDDSFYQGQAEAFENYATPELNRQFVRAGRDSTYQLADRGKLNSSTKDTMGATLAVERDRKAREISDMGIARANDLRGNVEDQRSRLISQVIASGDPSNATQGAIASASQFQTPQPMQGLGQFFNDWSNIWLNREANAAADRGYNKGMNAWGNLNSSYNVGGN